MNKIKYAGKETDIVLNEYNQGAIDMLYYISGYEGWEESERFYLDKFFNQK